MQAYQTFPCPFCGTTWNQPGAQFCAGCGRQLPPPQPQYAPPGYQPAAPPPAAPPAAYPPYQAVPPQAQPPGYGYQPQPSFAAYPQPAVSWGQGSQPPGHPQPAAGARLGGQLSILGQRIAVPFPLPAGMERVRLEPLLKAGVGLLGLLILFWGIVPGLAAGPIASSARSIDVAIAHQPTVDAGLAAALHKVLPGPDPAARKAQLDAGIPSMEAALASVRADEAALRSANQGLRILGVVSIANRPPLVRQRQRIQAVLTGLQQADEALTGSLRQAQLGRVMAGAYGDYAAMSAALARGDPATADGLYAAAAKKVQEATSLAESQDMPPNMAQFVSAFRELLDSSERFVKAALSRDAAGMQKASALVATSARVLNTFDQNAIEIWRTSRYQPLADGYRTTIKAAATY